MPKVTQFFPNEADGQHCLQACLRMVIATFEGRVATVKEVEEISGFKEGEDTWQYGAMKAMAQKRYEAVLIEAFDIRAFVDDPKAMLIKNFGEKTYEVFENVSDIDRAQNDAKACLALKNVRFEERGATLEDVAMLLEEGFLIITNVNSKALEGKEGWQGHFVIIDHTDGQTVRLQDPGLPGEKDKIITTDLLLKSWVVPDGETPNVLAFRKIET